MAKSKAPDASRHAPQGPSRHCGVLVAPHLEQHFTPSPALAYGNSSPGRGVDRRASRASGEDVI